MVQDGHGKSNCTDYRLEAVKQSGETTLYSRRGNILNQKFQYIADALKKLPDSTILDGEVVALDAHHRSDFNLLQNFRSAETKIHYYAFDILMLKGKLLTQLPLDERRAILAGEERLTSACRLAVDVLVGWAYTYSRFAGRLEFPASRTAQWQCVLRPTMDSDSLSGRSRPEPQPESMDGPVATSSATTVSIPLGAIGSSFRALPRPAPPASRRSAIGKPG